MISMKKNIIITLLAAGCLLNTTQIFSNLNWMPSNYWFAGYMYIAGSDDLTYNLYSWNNSSQKMELSPISLTTNTVLNLRDLFGGIDKCPFMWSNGDPATETKFILVPSLTFIPDPSDSATVQRRKADEFQKGLLAGREAPYIVVERSQGLINIFIIGPTKVLNSLSQKLSFNFLAFEQSWVKPSNWYNHLEDHSPGMAFAFSFDASKGTFLNSPNKPLSDDSFYIFGMSDKNAPLGWSWTYQGPENNAVKGMTMKTLQGQGIVQHQEPLISLKELQRIINFINSSGQGKFDNVL